MFVQFWEYGVGVFQVVFYVCVVLWGEGIDDEVFFDVYGVEDYVFFGDYCY